MELFVFLGDLCNFECSHCVTNSSPKANNIRISILNIEQITSEVNSNKIIKSVHFTGGEPTLFLNEIKAIQKRITRKIRFHITTNAWFGDKEILSGIYIDKVIISFDVFHYEFNDIATIKNTIEYCQNRNIEVKLNSVVDSDFEILSLISALPIEDINTSLSKLVNTGRASTEVKITNTKNTYLGYCPSLKEGGMDQERVIYIPEKGYTPCCSYLSYGDEGDLSQTYSKKFKDYNELGLLKKLKNNTFQMQREKYDPQGKTNYSNVCDFCNDLYSVKRFNGESLLRILIKKRNFEYQLIEQLPRNIEVLLSSEYEIGYILSRKCYLDSPLKKYSECISDDELNDILYRSIYQNFNEVTRLRYKELCKKLAEFRHACNYINVIRIDNEIQGLLIGNYTSEAFHIGFVYVSPKVQSKGARGELHRSLLGQVLKSSLSITARVDWFNQKSLDFFKKNNFQVRKVVCDIKLK